MLGGRRKYRIGGHRRTIGQARRIKRHLLHMAVLHATEMLADIEKTWILRDWVLRIDKAGEPALCGWAGMVEFTRHVIAGSETTGQMDRAA